MKNAMYLMVLGVLFTGQLVVASEGNGNSNNTIIVNGCGNSCQPKTRTIIKKVIVRQAPVVVEKQVIIEKPIEKLVYVDRLVTKKVLIQKERKKNRISLLGGVGPTKLDQPTPSQVNLVTGAVGALQYQRSITETFNLGVQVQTNHSVLGSVGIDF